MKKLWFFFLLVFLVAFVAFLTQEQIKDKIGIEKPDSEVGKKIDEALGLEQIRYVDRAKNVGTQTEFNTIKTGFVMYYTSYGEYPRSLEDLVAKGYIPREALSDFWQQGYRTELQGSDLVLTSPGPDRMKNTRDDIETRISLMAGGG